MADYVFPGQNNIGFPQTFKMNKAVPAIANRIFKLYAEAEAFLSDATVVPGLILRVIEDEVEAKNGAYLIKRDGTDLKLVKLAEGTLDITGSMVDIVKATDDKFYDKADCEETAEGWVPVEGAEPIEDSAVTEEGKYLKLELGEDVVYINSKDLIDLTDYYTKDQVDTKLDALDSSIDDRLGEDEILILDLDSSVKAHEERIAELEAGTTEKVEELEERLDVLDASMAANELAIEEAKDLADSNKVRLDVVDSSIADLDASIKEIDGKLEDLKTEIEEEIGEELEAIDASIEAIEAKNAELDEAIEDLQEALEEFMDSSLVKTVTTESLSDYVVLNPTTATTGDVTILADLVVVSMADASTNNKGLAEASDVKQYIAQQIASSEHLKFKVVETLPAKEEADLHTIYLVKKADVSQAAQDVYQEYMLIDGEWELLGDTTLNLDNYYTKVEMDEILADLSTALEEYVNSVEEELQDEIDVIDSSIKNIEETIEIINETNTAQEEHLADLDASVDRLDASVAALEDKVLNGVVNSLTSDSLEETGYVRLTLNVAATGDVELHLDADVVEHFDDEEAKQGLATTNYIEERFAWIEIEEAATADDLAPEGEHGSYIADDQPVTIADGELETLKTTEAGNIDIESQKEITIG